VDGLLTFRYFPFKFAETNGTVKGFPTEFVNERIGVADPDTKSVVNVLNNSVSE
jgi:hypothetical protein